MKHFLAILLVVSFVGIAVFGAFAMADGTDGKHSGCIAATAQGVGCPKEAGSLGFANFHLDALKSFSLATFGESLSRPGFVALLLSILFATWAGLKMIFSSPILLQSNPPSSYHLRPEFFVLPPKYRTLRWLALHENSPSYS